MTVIRPIAMLVVLSLGVADVCAGIRYQSNHGDYPSRLRSGGWGVAISISTDELSGPHEDDGIVRAGSPDEKRMVVQAIQDMAGHAGRVPLEIRQELVRIAEKSFVSNETKEGKIGNVEYRIGYYTFTNSPTAGSARLANIPGGATKRDSMPFVAIRLVEQEKPK